MTTFLESLSEESGKEWPEIYRQLTGRKWVPPRKDKTIQIESLGELSKLMKEKPNSRRR